MMVGRVLGLDPGLGVTGYGVVDVVAGRTKLVEGGVVRPGKAGTLAERLITLHKSVGELLEEHRPSVVAVEELYSHYERPKTAILMGHARGVILLAAAERNIPVAHYLPTRVKKALTGNGHASKEQMMQAIQLEFRRTEPITVPDVADAIAIALCHVHATASQA